jgi:hypothetical protein
MVLDTKDDRTIFFDLLPFFIIAPSETHSSTDCQDSRIERLHEYGWQRQH